METPVIVIGGGLCGLATAALLAREGVPAVVLERRRSPGGRARSTEVDGHVFNEGGHALYRGGAGERVLADLGVEWTGGQPQPETGAVLRDGRLFEAPFTPGRLLRSELLSVAERAEAARVLALAGVRRIGPATGMSTGEWCDRQTRSPAVRELLRSTLRTTTYCGDLDHLSAEVAVTQLRAALRPGPGVRYVDGGWGTLVAALAERVEVRCGVTVEAVRRGEGRVLVECAGGETLAASAVVVAGLSPEAAQRITGAAIDAIGPRMEVASLDVALRRLPRPDVPTVMGLDRPVFMTTQSLWGRMAPEGAATVVTVRYEPGADAKAELEGVLDLAQPGWRDELVHDRFLPSMTVVNAQLPPTVRLAGRPAVDAAGVPGVLLAGDWVGPEGWMTDAVLASAATAADRAANVARSARPALAAA